METDTVYVYDSAGAATTNYITLEYVDQTSNVVTKTDNYTVLVTDNDNIFVLGSATAADKAFTLDSMGADEDGYLFHFYNKSDYWLSLLTSNDDSIGRYPVGIEGAPGAFVSVKYDHVSTTFLPIQMGGKWRVEGLKLWLPCEELTTQGVDNNTTTSMLEDKAGKHRVLAKNNVFVAAGGVYPTCLSVGGSDEYGFAPDATSDFDFFGSKTGTKIILFRFYRAAAGVNHCIVCHWEDANNFWQLFASDGNALRLQYNSGGVMDIDINGGDVSATSTWFTGMAVNKDGDIALYLDNTQIAWLASADWSTDTFTGDLNFWRKGDDSLYLNGGSCDGVVCHSNFLGASPTSAQTDTIAVPDILNLVTEG